MVQSLRMSRLYALGKQAVFVLETAPNTSMILPPDSRSTSPEISERWIEKLEVLLPLMGDVLGECTYWTNWFEEVLEDTTVLLSASKRGGRATEELNAWNSTLKALHKAETVFNRAESRNLDIESAASNVLNHLSKVRTATRKQITGIKNALKHHRSQI